MTTGRDIPAAALEALHARWPPPPYIWTEWGRQTWREGVEPEYLAGRREARAAAILNVFEGRSLPVPDSVRERVLSCTDLDQLLVWAEWAVRGRPPEDLFRDVPESERQLTED
jgi:hypothetical protein